MKLERSKIFDYCEAHTSAPSSILKELERETYLKTLAPQMMCGHLQGRLLSWLSRMRQPQQILEVGTFTGYAALCLAEGLASGGQLHTIEVNEELAYLIRKYIQKAGMEEKITLHLGNAKELIPKLQPPFDIIFIDAGKADNTYYYENLLEHLRPGGLILVDNVLWSGKVVNTNPDADTRSIQAFNTLVHEDSRVENLLLPIRDGLIIAQKL